MSGDPPKTETALLISLQKDLEVLTRKVDELKADMRDTYATKADVNLIREWVKPYVDRQRHIEVLVIGALVAAVLKLVILP
jgi:hypothetical protein